MISKDLLPSPPLPPGSLLLVRIGYVPTDRYIHSKPLHKFFLLLGGARSYFVLHCTTLVMTFGNNLFRLLH